MIPLRKLLLSLSALAGFAVLAWWQRPSDIPRVSANQAQADPEARQMADAAKGLLDGLSAGNRKKAHFGFDDSVRLQWHYYPITPWPRAGALVKEMGPAERKLLDALLRAGTSEAGFAAVQKVMALDGILRDIENTPWAKKYRDPELYHICIFGEPSLEGRWGWRFEGHHLNLNYVIDKGRVLASTPSVWGANPALVPSGPFKDLRVLGREEDLARELLVGLNAEGREAALTNAIGPFDVLTEVKPRAKELPLAGVAYAKMPAASQKQLRDLLSLYAGKHPPSVAANMLREIADGGWDRVHFAWQGSVEPGQPHYYHIVGPGFAVEFCNTQNQGNHIHAVWRSYRGDFGL